MEKCQWKPPEGAWRREDYQCPHGTYLPKGKLCIFHISLEEKTSHQGLPEEFAQAFYALFFDGNILKDDAGDFRGFIFPNGINFSKRDFRRSYERDNSHIDFPKGHNPINFQWAIFGDRANFGEAKFGDSTNFGDTTFGNMANFGEAKFGDIAFFRNATFGNTAMFWRAIFKNKAIFQNTTFGDETYFWKTTFGDMATFRYATFGDMARFEDARFSDNATFDKVTFGDSTNFKISEFGNRANFRESIFGDNVNFNEATFGDGAMLRKATFGNRSVFYKTVFGNNAVFFDAIFGDGISFSNATFGDLAEFRKATFGDDVYFSGAKFLGAVDFSFVKAFETAFRLKVDRFDEPSSLEGHLKKPSKSKHLSFRETAFEGHAKFTDADLSRVRFELVNLQNLSFSNSKISQTEFIFCTWGSGPENRKYWHRSGGHLFGFKRSRMLLDELLWRKKNINRPPTFNPFYRRRFPWLKDIALAPLFKVPMREAVDKMEPPDDLNAEDIELLGLQLKQSLEATKDPITAGDFHFAVMEMKLEKARVAHRSARALALTLYKFINGYGERYARTLMWLALLVAVWTGLYSWNGEFVPSDWTCREVANALAESNATDLPPPNTVWEYLLFAFQNILPFKFGHPVLNPCSTWARALTFAETFIGTSLFSLMLLALRRRFKR